MTIALTEYLAGIAFILLLAIFAFKRNALTEGGTITAILIGLLVFIFPVQGITGRIWFALLAVFFLSSFFVTKFQSIQKKEVNKEFAKGDTRDYMQVFANGAAAALLAVIYYFYPLEGIFIAFAAALATVSADTWATELGILSRQKPFLITNLQRVDKGVSGAVSPFGLLAALAGALIIAVGAVFLVHLNNSFFASELSVPGGIAFFVVFVSLLGLLGSVIDSVLGATVQVMHYCKKCRKETERTTHGCSSKTFYSKGFKFFDNDVVNLVASLITAALAFFLYSFVAAL